MGNEELKQLQIRIDKLLPNFFDCLFLSEGKDDELVYQKAINALSSKKFPYENIRVMHPSSLYYFYATSLTAERDDKKTAIQEIKSLASNRYAKGRTAVLCFAYDNLHSRKAFGLIDRDLYENDPDYDECSENLVRTDACDLETTLIACEPSLIEKTLAVIASDFDVMANPSLSQNITKALTNSYLLGTIRSTQDKVQDQNPTFDVSAFYFPSLKFNNNYSNFIDGGGRFSMQNWIKTTENYAIGVPIDYSCLIQWEDSLIAILVSKGFLSRDSSVDRPKMISTDLSVQQLQSSVYSDRLCYLRFCNGHDLSHFLRLSFQDDRLLSDPEENSFERFLSCSFIEDVSALANFSATPMAKTIFQKIAEALAS
jgi:hypothetical protein